MFYSIVDQYKTNQQEAYATHIMLQPHVLNTWIYNITVEQHTYGTQKDNNKEQCNLSLQKKPVHSYIILNYSIVDQHKTNQQQTHAAHNIITCGYKTMRFSS